MLFSKAKLSDDAISSMVATGVWGEGCPVPLNRLMMLELSHYDFLGQIQLGHMGVLDKVADNVLEIFQELFALHFPINKISVMDAYRGNDDASMADNNSSCFNFRNMSNSNKLSMHAYGLAIDINPTHNPYIEIDANDNVIVHPRQGARYINRHFYKPGMVEPVVGIFQKHNFSVWGGKWQSLIDYHHFQVPREEVEGLLL